MLEVGSLLTVKANRYKKDQKILPVTIENNPDGYIRQKDIVGDPKQGQNVCACVTRIQNDGEAELTMRDIRQRPEWWKLPEKIASDKKTEEIFKETMLSDFAEKVASESVKQKPDFYSFPNSRLYTNALRNFYDAFKHIESYIGQGESLDEKKDNFQKQLPIIKLMKARVANSRAKQQPIPGTFAEFLNDSIDLIGTREAFNSFMLLFEAVAGWHTYFDKRR